MLNRVTQRVPATQHPTHSFAPASLLRRCLTPATYGKWREVGCAPVKKGETDRESSIKHRLIAAPTPAARKTAP